jgi:hypothetical protein
MQTIRDILSFCYEHDCTPSTLVFGRNIHYENLDDVVKNWKRGATSFLDEGLSLRYDEGLRSLRNTLMGDSDEVVDITRYEEEKFMFHRAHELIGSRDISLPSMRVVSYRADCDIREIDPKSVFNDYKLPFMIYNGMRKIPSSFGGKLPEWILEEARYDKDSVYAKLHGILIRISRSCISFKFDRSMDLASLLSEIENILDTEVFSIRKSRFITISEVHLSKPWKVHIMADIITNNDEVNQVISIQENSKLLSEKRYITSLCMLCKFAILDDDDKTRIRIFSPVCLSDTRVVLLIVATLFSIYDEEYDRLDKIYSALIGIDIIKPRSSYSTMRVLRDQEPDLFVNNYTRECPILPIIVDESEARPCILYHGRWYTAPEGYYVGLKMNRLFNRDKYKYLVTCYKTNHMLRESSITYRYTYGTGEDRTRPRKANSRKIDSSNYYVAHSKSFLNCIEMVLGKKSRVITEYGACCRQDLWFMDTHQILRNIANGNVNSSYYRYYEELYRCNIMVISISGGDYNVHIPRHKEKYIWNRHISERCILVIEVPSPIHIKEESTYELITEVFDLRDNNICSRFLRRKTSLTVRGVEPRWEEIVEQYVNHLGKCVMVRYDDGIEERCHYRPLPVAEYEPHMSVIKSHFEYINKVRSRENMSSLAWNESNSKCTFFPGIESLMMWKNDIHQQSVHRSNNDR